MENSPRELRHEPVPGYARIFSLAFAAAALYLACILLSSPGPAEPHGHPSGKTEAATSH